MSANSDDRDDFAPPRPIAELLDTGLLWLINRTVFHPRGFALGLAQDDDGQVTGWQLFGDGTEPWHYEPTGVEDGKFAAAEATLNSARKPQLNLTVTDDGRGGLANVVRRQRGGR